MCKNIMYFPQGRCVRTLYVYATAPGTTACYHHHHHYNYNFYCYLLFARRLVLCVDDWQTSAKKHNL